MPVKPSTKPLAPASKPKAVVASSQTNGVATGSNSNKSALKIPEEEALVMTEKTRQLALQNFKKREYSTQALNEIKQFIHIETVLLVEKAFSDLQVRYQVLYRVLGGEEARQIITDFPQELARTINKINQTGNIELLKKVRLGSPDKFSRLTLPELVKLADKPAVARVQRVILDAHAQTTTLRWILRGLSPTMAIKRTKLWQQKLLDASSTAS